MLSMLSASVAARRGEGQGLVEYALIIALASIVVIVALMLVGGNINNLFNSIGASVGN
jgi:pilus assembly protein Flp/PilA